MDDKTLVERLYDEAACADYAATANMLNEAADTIEAQATRIEALKAALRECATAYNGYAAQIIASASTRGTETMTIEHKAREIADHWLTGIYVPPVKAARLGIIEGRRQAFEEAVAIVQTARFTNPESLRDSIADAIRARIEEQKL